MQWSVSITVLFLKQFNEGNLRTYLCLFAHQLHDLKKKTLIIVETIVDSVSLVLIMPLTQRQ